MTPGGNYGWNYREGAHCYQPPAGCPTAGLIDPVAEYGHDSGNDAIIGGYVYRGAQTTELSGRYIFGDNGSGMIASLTPESNGTYTITRHVPPGSTPSGAPGPINMSAFGELNAGELYLLDYARGQIFQLIFTAGGGSVP